jgi:hypothetical protein
MVLFEVVSKLQIQSFLVAQASRLCCEQRIFSPTGETPVPPIWDNTDLGF